MKKSENLIVRVDPELKKVIYDKAAELEITTSVLIRDILSILFLVEYENERFSNFVQEKIEVQSRLLKQIIAYPLLGEDNQIKIVAKRSLQNLTKLNEAMNNSISKKLDQSSFIEDLK